MSADRNPFGQAEDTPKIGVYVCHCGTNIAGVIDVEDVAKYAEGLPGVLVSRDYKYTCSDPGQEMIQKDIDSHGLNRIVVASCSPCLHETTFRNTTERGGVNPFHFQMVNIREHAACVHADEEATTAKAKDLVRAAVRRVALHRPLQPRRIPVNPDVVVVGAGIAGIHAALTIANAGKRVYLVEREATIGGHMAQFDKTFPTLDCAACILTPKMTAVKAHPNITLWTLSDVTKVEGYVGNYDVTVRRRPRYVNEALCVGCLECIDACVYKKGKVEDEFNLGLSKRKPIYIPFPQAVPQMVVIDADTCVEFKSGKCKKTCIEACGERLAIDFAQEEYLEEINVGSVILSTGYKPYDPRQTDYGYGRYPNVYTSLEVERLVSSSGPTGGEIVMRDGRHPERVGILHCIGSRNENTNRYCSRVCCMYSVKLAHLIKERTNAEVYNFYIDMRTPGKDFEEFYNRVAEEGVHFIRGKVARVSPGYSGHDDLLLDVEDTLAGMVRRIPVDMVVLSVGLEPQSDAEEIRRRFGITCSKEGFFMERHPKLAPVNTLSEGIFLAGCCQGPKDIPDTVAQAGAAAGEALSLIGRGHIELEPNTAYVLEESCSGCRTCVPLCPYSAITVVEQAPTTNGNTLIAHVNEVLCKGCGVCVAACPSGSIAQNLFEDDQIFEEIEGVLSHA